MPHPLTWFVELPAAELAALVLRPEVLDPLAEIGACVAMAMLDLDPVRADVARALTARGIGLTAWLILEPHHGYWLTADNAELAAQRYDEVRAWILTEKLTFACIGLDIEMPHDDSAGLVLAPLAALGRLVWNRRSREVLALAVARYTALVDRIRGDGLEVETYQFPFLHDERQAGSGLLQRALGVVDVQADREVWMLYRSVLPPPWGELLVDAYGQHADAIAVGITGGGVAVLAPAFANRLLDLDGLLVDLRRARRYTDRLYVFSLEGCVEQGILAQVCAADLTPAAPERHRLRHVPVLGRLLLRGLLRTHHALHRLRRKLRPASIASP